jgi:hypothetical protein
VAAQSTRPQSKIHHESTLQRLSRLPALSTNATELYGDLKESADQEHMPMSAAREALRNDLLLEARGKPIDLNEVDWRVKHHNPSASPLEVQHETLDAIREWVTDGLFNLGALTGKSQRFAAWHHSLDHSMREISHNYVKHYGDPEKWMYSVWLSLTAKGESLAGSLEEKDIDGYRPKAPEV